MSFPHPNRILRTPVFFLVFIPVCVYAASLWGDFVYDDKELTVEGNPALTGDASVWEILQWDRPLREFTYMLDHALWGFWPVGYHLQNLVWHCGNVLLLYFFFQILGVSLSTAFWSALLFSIHPITTESVAWISGRKELLCLFFELGTCILFVLAYREKPPRSPWLYLASLLSCILALLSKQVAVALPLLLAGSLWVQETLRFQHAKNTEGLDWKKAVRFLSGPTLLVLATALFRFPIFRQLEFTREHGTFYDPGAREVAYTALAAILTPFATFLNSLWLCLWPLDLTVEREFVPVTSLADTRWILGMLLAAMLGWFAWRGRTRFPLFGFGGIWFVAAWGPVSGAAPVAYLLADRYLYIPCAGFCLAVIAIAFSIRNTWFAKWPRFSLALGIALGVLFSMRTFVRTLDWRNDIALWQAAVHSRPHSTKAYTSLGNAYADAGGIEKAFRVWNQALELDTHLPQIWVNMGNEENRRGNPEKAEKNYRKALELFPEYGTACFNLALLLEEQHRFDEALTYFRQAAEYLYHRMNTEQRKGLAHYHIARILFMKGDRQAAEYQLAYAEKMTPHYAPLYVLKGLLNQNQPPIARQAFMQALRLDPETPEAYFNLGVLEWQQGNRDEAAEFWKKAVDLNPSLNQSIQKIQGKNSISQ